MSYLTQKIGELGTIRKGIPQFFYCSSIWYLGANQVREKIIEFKKKNPTSKKIDFILNSGGGSPDSSYRILRTLRKNFEEVNIVVPFWAKSAATLLSLGGSNIIFDEWGEFGALDVQLPKERADSPHIDESESALIDEISLDTLEDRAHSMFVEMFMSLYENDGIPVHKDNIIKDVLNYVAKFYEPLLSKIDPHTLGDKKRKLDIGKQYAQRIMIQFNPNVKKIERDNFIEFLINGCPDHGYIVDYDLINKFLHDSNIKQSTELDKEYPGYSNKLSEISVYLIGKDGLKENFIGFIDENTDKKDETDKGKKGSKIEKKKPSENKKQKTTPQKINRNGKLTNGKPTKQELQSAL